MSSLKLIINGDPIEIPDSVKTVSELLEHFQLDQKVVIVEKNKEILQKEHHVSENVQDGDQFELVHFVGGG
ncbi:sulfur carrier protein ThiS [Sutcliffiella horikoshii]|uniref:sulfur carrier protein ThiS n=1 Tax=Sutcliffiella horikoshii TaxID=79883 RepID=UPI003CC839B0